VCACMCACVRAWCCILWCCIYVYLFFLYFFVQVVALIIVRPGKEGVDEDKVGKVLVQFGRVLYVMNLYSKS
jgi:hypothetical protein